MWKIKINFILIFLFLVMPFANSDSLTRNSIGENVIGDILDSAKKSFSQYQVLKVKHSPENRERIFRDLQDRVDIWNSHSSGNETLVDFLVSPSQNLRVKQYLISNGIPFQVMLSDVELVIESQSNCNKIKMSPNHEIKKTKSKRSTRHNIRDFLQIVAHSTKTMIKTGDDEPKDVISRRADYPYKRIPRKALLNNNDPELLQLDGRMPRMSWTQYHNLETIYAFMRELEEQFPQLIDIIEIGQTFERRPILLAKISKKTENIFGYTQNAKRAVFIEGGIHAREWISPAVATFMIRELVVNSNFNSDVLDIFDFYVLPVSNPDGYAYSHRTNRMWRKNRSPNRGIGAMLNPCWGVDLNRNFGYQWGSSSIFNQVGGTHLPCLETYSGPKAWSELETRAIRDFVLNHRGEIEMYVALHSYGEKVMYPWSHSKEKLPDWQELHSVGITMADAITSISGIPYWVGSASDSLYVSSGSGDDWLRGSAGIKWVYLMELPDKEYGFLLPPTEILRTAHSIFNGIRAGAIQVASTFYTFNFN